MIINVKTAQLMTGYNVEMSVSHAGSGNHFHDQLRCRQICKRAEPARSSRQTGPGIRYVRSRSFPAGQTIRRVTNPADRVEKIPEPTDRRPGNYPGMASRES